MNQRSLRYETVTLYWGEGQGWYKSSARVACRFEVALSKGMSNESGSYLVDAIEPLDALPQGRVSPASGRAHYRVNTQLFEIIKEVLETQIGKNVRLSTRTRSALAKDM